MDKEPGKSAQSHRVDHSAHLTDPGDTTSGSGAPTTSNANSNANNITGGVGMLVNNSQNNNQNINYFVTGAIPNESVGSNHGMLSTEY